MWSHDCHCMAVTPKPPVLVDEAFAANEEIYIYRIGGRFE